MTRPAFLVSVSVRMLAPAAALLALAALLASCGDTEEEVTPGDAANASSTQTPALSPSPSPTTTAAGKAPDGCLTGELAYSDPAGRFAFCYPNDMKLAFAVDTGQGIAPTVMHPIGEKNRVVVTFGWEKQRRSATGEACLDSPYLILNKQIEQVSIAGMTADACLQDHYERDKAGNPSTIVYKTIQMEVQVTDGFVQVDAAYFGPDWERAGTPVVQTAMRILESAMIR